MLVKEPNNSHQSSLLIGPNGLLNGSKLMYQFSSSKDYTSKNYGNISSSNDYGKKIAL